MKIRNGVLIEDDFISAFQELMFRDMSVKQCHELSVCLEEIISHIGIVRRTKSTLIRKYAKKDGDEFACDADGNLLFETPDEKKKCTTEIGEVMLDTIDIPLTDPVVFYADEVMTPRKYNLLKDIIQIVEREEISQPA